MEYPRFVYKAEGPHQRDGGSYDFLLVVDDSSYDAAIRDGWYPSIPDAVEAGKPQPTHPNLHPTVSDDAPVTRAELEAKATELGIKFDARFGDKKLSDLIASRLGG